MVRETRHLWVGNLPENIREDRIRDHFKRYGRVQSVKLLPRVKDDEGSGVCATVSFMDIKSASKAHNNEQKLEDRALSTEYHEPAAIPGGSASASSLPPLYTSTPRFSHGPPDEITGFERSSHFYERRGEGDATAAYLRRPPASTYHVSAQEPPLRGRTRDRLYRNGPYTPIIESVVSRNPATHHRSSWSYESASRYPPPSTTPEVSYPEDRREPTPVVHLHKKHSKSSRLQCRTYCRSGSNGSESGSNSGSSGSRSRSSSSSSQSGSSTCSSGSSSPNSEKSCSTHSHHGSLRSGVTLQSAVSTPHTNTSSPAVHGEDRRPLAICVRNLPVRSSDTSLKDGLFHEYKKHGKVRWVKVVGQGGDRYALVCFKKADDVDKALHVSHDKLFFGCKIEVAPYQGYDVDDNEFRPYETEQDEFHPKATRTLFIGNLEKDITAPQLRKHFDQFGEIIEIDIKKQGSTSSYAFCQYCDIGSVVRAMRTLDGEHLGNNRIKLGFGKSMHTNCVWVDGVAESVNDKYLMMHFTQYGHVSQVAIDRSRGHALVFYDQIASAQAAVKEMRGVCLRGRKLQVDFASRECQEAFYDHLEKQSNSFENSTTVQSPQGLVNNAVRGFETPSSSSSSSGGGVAGAATAGVAAAAAAGGRYPGAVRYSGAAAGQPQQPGSATTVRSASAVLYSSSRQGSPGASSPSTPVRTTTPRSAGHQISSSRFDFNSDYPSERRSYRGYDELANEDNCGGVSVVVGPPDIRHLQKERVALLEQLEDCPSSGEEGGGGGLGGRGRRCKQHRRSQSGEGSSRPGTPLCDERPENLPAEPRRRTEPRQRPVDPLSLPLPRFASQVLSPRPAPPSPPASPTRPRSSSSDDSEPSPPSPEWEERLRSLDEKYEKWSGSRTAPTKVDATSLRIRHKLLDLDLNELQPSDIVKSVLAKRSVFDEDSKRLENFGEKYEPREFIPSRPLRTVSRLDSPLHSPATATTSPLSTSSSSPAAKGLQYPFPSHPPVQPTTSVATTTAPASATVTLVTVLTTAPASTSAQPADLLAANTSSSSCSFPTSCAATTVSSSRQFAHMSSVNYPLPKMHSPASPSDRRLEPACEVSNPRLSTPLTATSSSTFLDKSKSVQKLTCTKNDKCDIASVKDTYASLCRPVNVCNRRDSVEDRESEGRRRSREELPCEVKQNADCVEKKDILGEGDKTKDTEMCDRRKRRPSIDVKDSVRKDISDGSTCDKFKDNHPKDRRRDSVDISSSVHKDDVSVDISCSKLKLNETKKDCNSDNSEITSSTFESSKTFTDFENVSNKKHDNMERRKDSEENVKHSLINPLDKKKDIFGVSSEKDRRRPRENVDSSNENTRLEKVPDNLERNREMEAESRHRDGALEMRVDSDDTTKKTALEPVERRKESHSEHPRNNVIPDKRKEIPNDTQHDSSRHKEKKEHSSDKERRRDKDTSEHLENSRHKSSSRKSPEINEIHKHPRDSERKRTDSGDSAKSKDCSTRKESTSSDDTPFKHSETKKESENQTNRLKDVDKRKEIDVSFDVAKIIQKKESDALEHRSKESRKETESLVTTCNRDNDRRREEHLDPRLKDLDKRRHSATSDSARHKDHDSSETFKFRESEKRRDGDFQDYSKYKDTDKKKESDCFDYNKIKDSDKKKECDVADTRQREEVKESNETIKHKRIDANHQDISRHQSTLEDDLIAESNAFELLKNKENDKRKGNDYDFSRHKHSDSRKDHEITENCKTRDFEKRKEYDISGEYSVHKDIINRKENEQLEVYKHKDFERRNDIFDSIKLRESERKNSESSESHRRKEDKRRDTETDNNKYKDHSEKKRDFDSDKYKHRDLERKREEKEKRRERENSEMFDGSKRDEERRKEREAERIEKMRKNRDNEIHDRHKEMNHDCFEKRKEEMNEKRVTENHDKRKDVATSDDNERKGESIKKEKRKERTSSSSSSWPAAIGCKRRLSSQDSLDSSLVEEVKRSKPERRDSKDSGKSSSSSKKSSSDKHKNFTKMLEEKIKEDKEKEIHRKKKEEESAVENKIVKPGIRKEKRNSGEKRKEDRKGKPRRDTVNTCSDTDGSGDDESKASKKHSIFDIVDDEPAYISMYDKVKARSTKNMQKLEEEKRQERLKEKFNQLKQCRAKREEKKRSTSYDEDSDSERGLSRRNKLLITSSEEDGGSENDLRMKGRKIMSDTSEDDNHKHNVHRISKPMRILSEDLEPKQRKIMSDTSEDDSLRMNILRVKNSRIHSFENDLKSRKITSDTSEDDSVRINMKSKITRINSDESETDIGFVDSHKTDDETPQLKSSLLESSDLFSNISEDHDNLGENEIDSDSRRPPSGSSFRRNSVDSNPPSTNELPRKKSHKKKQKRQKNSDYNDGCMSNKRHSSKKDRRKSAHSRDGDDESKSSDKNKIRKKKSDRETTKRDEKMEDIFGPLSDDSDKVIGKWQVSQVYGSDSESDREVQRKREKKRRERKARELDEAGRALEAKLLDASDSYINEEPIKTKKKKRKKSRDEKIKHHHKLDDDPPVLPPMIEQDQETVVDLETEPEKELEPVPEVKPSKPSIMTQSLPSLIDSPPHLSTHNKKPDIPGFGAQVDENIHETAVKSISESSTKRIEPMKELEEPPSSNPPEEKSTAISQEETEDAVAALLMEDAFGGGFESSEIFPAEEETTKPDTPVSEPDLQIDTDTEDTFDPVEFSRSAEAPRTPEMHSDYYRQQQDSGREGLEERILAMACPDNSEESQMPTAKSVIESPSLAKIDDKSEKKRDHLPMDISEPKTAPKVKSPDVEHTKATIPSVSNEPPTQTSVIEISKRHELPPIVKQVELLHPVKIAQTKTLSEQYKHTLNLSESAFKSHIQSLPSKPIAAHIPTLQPVVIKPMKPDDLIQERKQFPLQANPAIFHNQHHPNAKLHNQIVQPSNTAMMIGQKVQPIHPSKLVTPVSQHQPLNKMLTVHIDKPSCQPLMNSTSVSPRPSGQQLTPQPVQNKHHLSPTPPTLLQIHTSKEPVSPLLNQHHPSQVIQKQSQMQQSQHIILVKQKQEAQLHHHDHLVKSQQQFQLDKKEHHILQQKPPTSQKPHIEESQSNLQKDRSSIVSEELKQKDHNIEPRKNTDIPNQMNSHINTQTQPKIVTQASPTVISSSSSTGTSPVTKLQTASAQLLPVTGSPLPAPVSETAKEALSPREQDGFVKGSRLSPTVQHIHSQPSPNQVIHRPAAPMAQALHKQPVFPVSNSSEIKKDSQPIAVYSNIHKNHKIVKDEKHMDPFDKIVEMSQSKKDSSLMHSKLSPTIHSLKQAVQEKLHEDLPNPKDLDFASCKNFKPVSNHIDYKPVSQDLKQTKEIVSEVKPLNSVIQDLTEKISKEKQVHLNSIDDEKEKPIDLMVQEIHQRKISALNSTDADSPKNLVKEEDSVEVKEIKTEPPEDEKPLSTIVQSVQLDSKLEKSDTQSELKAVDPPVSVDTKKEVTLDEDVKKNEDSAPKTSPMEVDESKPETETDIKELQTTAKEDTKVNMLRIKKEDIVDRPFSPDLAVAPSTPKMEEIESSVFVKPGESSTEPCDDETAKQDQDVPDDTKDLKDDKDEEPLATLLNAQRTNAGGRGGRRRKAAGGRGGGVATRRTRLNNRSAASTPTADVYEFRDDSEEETGRPRLILTIKSPVTETPQPPPTTVPPPPPPPTTTAAPPPPPPPSSTPATTTGCSTRKSRRLQEKDVNRTTIDDTIEDVIRGTRSSTRRGARAAGLAAAATLPTPSNALETRKSPRRKQANRSQTPTKDADSPESPPAKQSRPSTPTPAPAPAPPAAEVTNQPSTPSAAAQQQSSPAARVQPTPTPPKEQPADLSPAAPAGPPVVKDEPCKPQPPPASKEPMTLIDPVTGLLIPMQESEEGQYVPLNNNGEQVKVAVSVAAAAATAVATVASVAPSDVEDSGEPREKRMRTTVVSLPADTSITSVTCAPPPAAAPRPLTGAPVRPGVGVAVVKPVPPKPIPPPPPAIPAKPPLNCVTVTMAPPPPQMKVSPRPILTSPKPLLPPTTSITTSSATPTGIVKPSNLIMSAKAAVVNQQPPPPVTLNRVVVAPNLTSTTNPMKSGIPPTQVNSNIGSVGVATTPINHKAHLLQAVNRGKVPVAKVPTPMTPKAHILQSIGNVNCNAREGIVGPGTPPPPHHGSLLTGSVASPPLRAHSQQPIVTGASSSRAICKPIVDPIKMEPLKMEAGATAGINLSASSGGVAAVGGGGGCIVVPTASPQQRGQAQVMQAGLPVPAYEASLHGVVAELLPNPQWPRQSPPPAHQHPAPAQGEVVQHVNYIQPAHYVHSQLMYQQYLREAAMGAAAYQFTPGVKAECEDAARVTGGSPPGPLELRRGSPHDRTTDSPQVATLYVHGQRHLYYEGPPPAHRPSQPRLQVATPPHASQVPPQADSLLMLLQRYPVMWQGLLALKNDQAAVQMHFVFGNPHVARDSLPCNSDGSTPPLRIAQRMRLEQTQVEGVARKMQMDNEHCMLLALPCGRDHMDVLQQSNNLQSGFITYLQQKQAAGIVNIAVPGSQQAAYVVHIFPACDFANESLARIAPDLLHRVADIAHLLIVIATV
ncbi:hypothetical protein LSTR_LSTR004699 [Laodelphax striatellus]|uniref:Msx2-interacting protein n=1 Tax=Laodelphax striatellus TaxID=195883 RepID=A0A482WV27_LAOST|nr:hypothetical protein LSTR_LSTR004699 [Laodelphax striatellus]